MGMYHSAYCAFGARVAEFEWDDVERLEMPGPREVLTAHNVGYLLAGHYDQDKLFLTTACASVDPGSYARVPQPPDSETAEREAASIRLAAETLGLTLAEDPAWFFVPDLS